ncbi:MAG TPA: PIG-L deacetylase family protein [Methylomirabilota bacterium]|nr:PIG-L deacetylase family protein [Methylomirabilota bacterium]
MNILAIGAHPDDIEYGCAGMLAKYAKKEHAVFMFVASDGALGGDAAVRRREQEESAQILGVRKVFWGEYRDTEVPLSRDLIVRIETVIRQVEPRMIFVNSPEDTHQDHRHLAQCAMSATRYVPNFLFFEVPSTIEFRPNCSTDIADVLDTKLASLAAHRSQVTKTNIEDLTILELAKSSANFRGIQARVKYAEAFQSVRLLLNL